MFLSEDQRFEGPRPDAGHGRDNTGPPPDWALLGPGGALVSRVYDSLVYPRSVVARPPTSKPRAPYASFCAILIRNFATSLYSEVVERIIHGF